MIRAAFGSSHCGMPLRYLENPAYERGPRLSLWTGREFFRRDDVLLADADVLFAPALLQRVVGAPASNVFLALAGLSRHGRGGGPVLPRPRPRVRPRPSGRRAAG